MDLRERRNHNQLLHTLAKLTDERELETAVLEMDSEDFVKVGVWISSTCRLANIQRTLIIGGLLYLYSVAAAVHQCTEVFENLLADIGISKSQAYRSRDSWIYFGRVFIDEPKITDQFVAESIKLLSEPQATDLARQEALERARNGERISIAVAKATLAKHSQVLGDKGKSERKAKTRRAPWMFEGQVSKIIVRPAMAGALADPTALIKDLEDAINALSQQVYATA